MCGSLHLHLAGRLRLLALLGRTGLNSRYGLHGIQTPVDDCLGLVIINYVDFKSIEERQGNLRGNYKLPPHLRKALTDLSSSLFRLLLRLAGSECRVQSELDLAGEPGLV